MKRWHWLYPAPCCTACDGTGTSWDIETGGLCWDCQASGHAHAPTRWQGWAARHYLRIFGSEIVTEIALDELHRRRDVEITRLDASLIHIGPVAA